MIDVVDLMTGPPSRLLHRKVERRELLSPGLRPQRRYHLHIPPLQTSLSSLAVKEMSLFLKPCCVDVIVVHYEPDYVV